MYFQRRQYVIAKDCVEMGGNNGGQVLLHEGTVVIDAVLATPMPPGHSSFSVSGTVRLAETHDMGAVKMASQLDERLPIWLQKCFCHEACEINCILPRMQGFAAVGSSNIINHSTQLE